MKFANYLLLPSISVLGEKSCPDHCLCDRGGYINCFNSNMTIFPDKFPQSASVLKMERNRIRSVDLHTLLPYSTNLTSIFISRNELISFRCSNQGYTFNFLTEVDLSYNFLNFFAWDCMKKEMGSINISFLHLSRCRQLKIFKHEL